MSFMVVEIRCLETNEEVSRHHYLFGPKLSSKYGKQHDLQTLADIIIEDCFRLAYPKFRGRHK